MIAGRGPFDDFTGEMEIGKAHIDMTAPVLSRFAAVPAPIEQLVMSALQKDPALRPRDAFSFASALRDLKKQMASGASSSRTSAATVEQVVAQPVSAARPATPFGAQPTHDVVPASGPETRIDAPAGKHAATAAAGAASRQQTLALGLRAQVAQETFAAAPLTMNDAAPHAAPQPAAIDRSAETRAAAPQPVQRPHYDTAPIPLAVFARPESTAPPQSSTFGAHTTEASQRKKASRSALVFGIVTVAVVALVGLGGAVVVYKQRHATIATPTPPPATTQAVAPVVTDSVTTISNAPLPTTTATIATIPAATIPAATTAVATDAVTTATAAPVVHTAHTASTPPIHTTVAATTATATQPPPQPTATSVATTAPTTTHHRPGSGL